MNPVVAKQSSPLRGRWLRPYPRKALLLDAQTLARDLLGRCIVRRLDSGDRMVMRIVETEAYLGAIDRASHAWGGRQTTRTATLYRTGGCWYVYFIYGMHHCLNVVAYEQGTAQAVLIRAGEVLDGIRLAATNRPVRNPTEAGALAGGPGKICQALAIDRRFDARPVRDDGLMLVQGNPVADHEVARGPRIGVDYAGAAARWPLRFAVKGHPEMSRPRL